MIAVVQSDQSRWIRDRLNQEPCLVGINPQGIHGIWGAGIALDFHTVSSKMVGTNAAGEPRFETVRSEIGELLYRWKYGADATAANDIISTAADYLRPSGSAFDLIVPVPPSTPRPVQPVLVLADGIGAALGLPVATCVKLTRPATALKNITDYKLRHDLLKDLYEVDAAVTTRKNVLLFDDLFRSGATMTSITSLLRQQGNAASVSVLTITRTRSRR